MPPRQPAPAHHARMRHPATPLAHQDQPPRHHRHRSLLVFAGRRLWRRRDKGEERMTRWRPKSLDPQVITEGDVGEGKVFFQAPVSERFSLLLRNVSVASPMPTIRPQISYYFLCCIMVMEQNRKVYTTKNSNSFQIQNDHQNMKQLARILRNDRPQIKFKVWFHPNH